MAMTVIERWRDRIRIEPQPHRLLPMIVRPSPPIAPIRVAPLRRRHTISRTVVVLMVLGILFAGALLVLHLGAPNVVPLR